jgi:hypothetical protein
VIRRGTDCGCLMERELKLNDPARGSEGTSPAACTVRSCAIEGGKR